MNTFDFLNFRGVPLWVRLVRDGERYGQDGVLVNQGETLVEFYDARWDFEKWLGKRGQYVSRYYLSTLREHGARGLALDAGFPDWSVTAAEMSAILAWIGEQP